MSINSGQRIVVVLGAFAIAASSVYAPFNYLGNELPSETLVTGTVYSPMYDAPRVSTIIEHGASGPIYAQRVDLDSGKLGLIWAAIAAATLVVFVLAADKPRAASP